MGNDILSIHCPSCGAPAKFDIVRQVYTCGYCGGTVRVEAAQREKKTMQRSHRHAMGESAKEYALETACCTGCGARLVFEQGEAISNCAFCGRSLVRNRYVYDGDVPQYVVPFGLTRDEAMGKLEQWCDANASKCEAKSLRPLIPQVNGYYLPYQMIGGPVTCHVGKEGDATRYEAKGYIQDGFVNCSDQLDNLLLDAMEPYDLEGLEPFDFAYVAGHRVKVGDIDREELKTRTEAEIAQNYQPKMQKVWGTRAIWLEPELTPVVELPALLPVYYIHDGKVKAAVNGQTGKVSVKAQKDSLYISLPWWLKGIFVLLIACAATFGAFYLGTKDVWESLYVMGILSIFYLIVFACMFQDPSSNSGDIVHYRKIFTSGEQAYKRERGELVPREETLERKVADPVFMRNLDGKDVPVTYTFRSLWRILGMIALSVAVIFLPVIVALIINGFNFEMLELGGSAVWFCIAVPVVPILLIRYGIQWLYDAPIVYTISKNGRKKRYHRKVEFTKEKILGILKGIGIALFVPPVCLITWCFILMVYLTAFGF